LGFNSNNQLLLTLNGTAAVTTAAAYADPSAWYHIVYAQNGAAQTIYVNGSSVGTGTTANTVFNTAIAHQLGAANTANYFDGYLTEVNFIDGQALTPSSFGQIESTTGVWSPKQYVGTYGTNGFYLKFGNTTSPAALGTDTSGNGNTWAVNNVLLTAGGTYDSMLDVPANYSDSGNGRGNYAVLNPLDRITTATLAAANLETTSAAAQNIIGSMSMNSGSWYWEIAYSAATASQLVGVYKATATTVAVTPTTSVIGLRFNADTGALDYTVNGSTYTSIATGLTGGGYFPYAGSLTNAKVIYANFGQRPFTYTRPAGFLALNTNNLPTPSIVNGANFMAATTYTGTAGVQSILNTVNGVSFQPDFVWIKSRTPGATNHALFDSVRGTGKYLSSNSRNAETTNANTLTAFSANGFSLGTDTTLVNASANSYIAWQWKESIQAGLDIVSFTTLASGTQTINHSLGVIPAMYFIKCIGAESNWALWHKSLPSSTASFLNINFSANPPDDAGIWGTGPTSSAIQVEIGAAADPSQPYIAYLFAEIAGFSHFSSYTGNGSPAGPFVFCGFRPRFVMIKRTDATGDWQLYDTTRSNGNVVTATLAANLTNVEGSFASGYDIDLLSNGFKLRASGSAINATGGTYIFAAFAEVPSKYALAR
jgi:hypothetical protein